ncbi:MAG: lamin tail domain-containing protein, partial [Candidatus Marinimicrobia bacterium]|nr:lamin tail domain-containing protein [Candidatus Neomarinimicrobiota bacterium]
MKINIIKKFCILLTCLFSIVALYGQLTFSEVMFDPSTNEYYDEFIEVYNYSNTSVLLKSTVLDRPASLIINGSEKTLYSPDDNYLIKSGQRAVILDNGYLVEQKSNTYDEMIPDTVLLLTIEGASFGLGNDDGNELLLIHPVSNDTISAYTTTPDQKEGHSDEKILLEGENTEENWGNSLAQKGTPGLPNSITPRDYDLGIINAELVRPQRPLMGDDLFIELEIENKGLESASGAELLCGLDRDQDSTLQSDEIGFRKDISLEPGEIFSQEVSFENQNIHESIVIANISYPDDRNQTDNQKLVQIEIGYPDTCLVINEIMYDPDQGSDWIELHNKSSFTINLKNWKIFDAVGYKTIPDKDWFLSPKAHIAVVEDSSFLDIWEDDTQILSMGGKLPNFNNSGDEIIVRDHTNRTIDSLRYEG